jgi:hypothetical protein
MAEVRAKRNGRHPEWDNLESRLINYKEMQQAKAKSKGEEAYKKFMATKTLTAARKVLRGEL